MAEYNCPRCKGKRLYSIRRGQWRCSSCRYEFRTYPVAGLRLDQGQWQKLTEYFLLERSGWWLAQQLSLNAKTAYKAIRIIRHRLLKDAPQVFSGTVEVDETYVGGAWKNKRKVQKANQSPSKRGKGTTKQPVFGILCRGGYVYAEVVTAVEAEDVAPIIEKKVTKGAMVCSDTWRAYTGLATRGYLHRTVEHGKGEYARGRYHINGLEGFFGYLKRKLAGKGGVRRKYLPLFLGEYVWRYNNRKLSFEKQVEKILNLISRK